MDPLKELIKNEEKKKKNAALMSPKSQSQDPDEYLKQKTNKKALKLYLGAKTVRIVKRYHLSYMAMAMRQFFIKSLKKCL